MIQAEQEPRHSCRTPAVVALTGARNFLANGLMRKLVERSEVKRLVVLDTERPRFDHERIVFYNLDLTNPTAGQVMADIFRSEGVEAYVHAIYSYGFIRNRLMSRELESIGTMHMLNACQEAGVKRIIVRSSTQVYGPDPQNPAFCTEMHPTSKPNRESSHVHEKVEMEKQVIAFARSNPDTCVTILRSCNTLGPTAENYLAYMLLKPAVPTILGYDPLMQFLHEDDLYRAYLLVLQQAVAGVFNIVGRGTLRYGDVLRTLKRRAVPIPERLLRLGLGASWNLGTYDVPKDYLDYLKYSCLADGGKALRELGFVAELDARRVLEDFYRTRIVSRRRGEGRL